ncbi:MAG TPA: RDD family protein [Vicinamibacteria bacterium]|nr:RDD family protein [Vicinamibacteria bacterium]
MTDRDLQQKRYIAAAIDIAVAIGIGLAFGIVSVIAGFVFGRATSSSMIGVYLPRVVSFVGSLVGLGYVLGRDVVTGDRSLGKQLQGIRVVTVAGLPIGFMESARRNAIFAIGSALGVISATLQLVPCLGDVVSCLLIPFLILGGLISLGAAVYELLQITQRNDGVRYGDQMAGTRVVR